MNPRIKQLAEQAKDFMTDQVSYLSSIHNRALSTTEAADIFEEKFAELIVRECAAEADKCAERGSWMAGYRIKQHFGVEL